uniref:hypothetical protein n=1 Tax=Anaerovibrio sp. TaxID=1872532 RepID=UPI0025D4C83A
ISEFKTDYPKLYECIKNEYNSIPNYKKYFDELYLTNARINAKLLFNYLNIAKFEELVDLLEVRYEDDPLSNEKISSEEDHKQIVESMLAKGTVKTDYPPEKVLKIIEDVRWMRSQRNDIMHANSSKNLVSSKELTDKMKELLNDMEELLSGGKN